MNVVQFSVEPLLRVAQALPATPRIMAELGRLLTRADTDLKDVATQLKRDSTLSARLLRIANSAAFCQSEPVASIEDAAALIGLGEIHRIAGAVAVDQFSHSNYPLYGFTGRQLRENSLLVALLMEELAPLLDDDPKSAYTIGLFRSIGKLALEKLAGEFGGASPLSASGNLSILLWEKHGFGISSNESTAIILEHWRFPAEVSHAVANHYLPDVTTRSLAPLLNLATGIADRLGHGLPGEGAYCAETDEAYQHTNLTADQARQPIERAVKAFERLDQLVA